jgi:hypothetical protein
LGIEHDKFFSIVMFWGECELKTALPPNVMTRGYISYIKSKIVIIFSDAEVQAIVSAIKTGMLPKTWATRKQHIDSLNARFTNKMLCPKCNSPLVLRTAKIGVNAGSQFYGCTKYPACRYVAQLET